ncbi:MAG: lysophospholipid acyltransferase family protein [Candidatus Competibacterales bacterium]
MVPGRVSGLRIRTLSHHLSLASMRFANGDPRPSASVQPPGDNPTPARRLLTLNRLELGDALGVPRVLQPPLAPLLTPAARALTDVLLDAEATLGAAGLRAAMARLVERYTAGVIATAAVPVPARGPLLILANHPGLMDAPALVTALPRDDVVLVARQRPWFDAMPHLRRHLLELPAAGSSTRALGLMSQALAAGRCVVLFPAGAIEPDPQRDPAAHRSLARWSRSFEWLAKRHGDLAVVPAAIGGVLHPKALAHPLVALRRRPAHRAWLAASLQAVLPRYWNRPVAVHFGAPLPARADAATLRRTMAELLHRVAMAPAAVEPQNPPRRRRCQRRLAR